MPDYQNLYEKEIFMANICIQISSDKVGLLIVTTVHYVLNVTFGGHSGRVVTLSPPTSEAGVRFPARPQVEKLVVACHWSAVYSTEH